MIVVPCPNCGPRNASDLRNCGEAVVRPNPSTTSLREWRTYLYIRENPAGWLTETWYCRNGCRRYFTIERNTSTNEIRENNS
jgi:heterotetrameric sarcosine oxidase delta subunit